MGEAEKSCQDPANALLIWYLNGSLAGEEAEHVRLHLMTCVTCRSEMDDLSQVGRHIQDHALHAHGDAGEHVGARASNEAPSPGRIETPRAESARRWIHPKGAIAAAAALLAAVVLLWYAGRHGSEPRSSEESILALDLGEGAGRGADSTPRLLMGSRVREVRLSFLAPINPEATYEIEVNGPLGEVVMRRERGVISLDSQGRSEYSLPADRLTAQGSYDLILKEFTLQGEIHEYHYPFQIVAPDHP